MAFDGERADSYERAISALLTSAIADGVASAAAAAIGGPGRRRQWIHGTLRATPDTGPPITAATPFDIASLTKPMATALVAMALLDDGRLDLDRAAAHWLPALDPAITVAHLLGHASGLPAHVKLYERLWAGDLGGAADPRAGLVAMAAATAIERAPGTCAVYSDLGYIVLAAICERVAGAALEDLTERVLGSIGVTATRFVDLSSSAPRPLAPATEWDARRGLVAGEVHDENCHAAGGIAGHAGLFAPIGDVEQFAAVMALGPTVGVAQISAARIRTAFSRSVAPDTSWRLGWDTPSAIPGVSHAGDRWPRIESVGHLGFTGTSIWLDWRHGRYAVLLTNRVHPRRDRPQASKIKDLRREMGDLAWQWLEA